MRKAQARSSQSAQSTQRKLSLAEASQNSAVRHAQYRVRRQREAKGRKSNKRRRWKICGGLDAEGRRRRSEGGQDGPRLGFENGSLEAPLSTGLRSMVRMSVARCKRGSCVRSRVMTDGLGPSSHSRPPPPAGRDELSKLGLEPEVLDFSEFVSVCVRNRSSRLHIATPLSIHLCD